MNYTHSSTLTITLQLLHRTDPSLYLSNPYCATQPCNSLYTQLYSSSENDCK